MAKTKKEPQLGRSDPVDHGTTLEAHFEGLKKEGRYHVHVLDPTGQSTFRQLRAKKDGTLVVSHESPWIGRYVVEVREDEDGERIAYAHGTVNPPSDHPDPNDPEQAVTIRPQVPARRR